MESRPTKKLGIMLSTSPEHPNVQAVIRLSQEALASGIEVYLYLIDEGVKNLSNAQLRDLTAKGLKYFACAYGCQRHNVSMEGYGQDVTFCGLVVLSNIINGCDRFLAFN